MTGGTGKGAAPVARGGDDPYRRLALVYDRLFEPMNRGLREIGLRMLRPEAGQAVLDVGCGTGAHLAMYAERGCRVHGLDPSPSMLARARLRLDGAARLNLASATDMPYADASFDLVLCMLVLHEMDPPVRERALAEVRRVLRPGGRVLVVDFHAGRPQFFRGWWTRAVILLSEALAGRRHFRNHELFLRAGGLPACLDGVGLPIDRTKVVGGGTLALYVLRPTG